MKKAPPTALRLPTLVCAWCKGVIRTGGSKISHGICPSCVAKRFQKLPASARELPPRRAA